MKFGIVVFPGSNCDDDMLHVLGHVMGQEARKLWHKDEALPSDFSTDDCIVLPGGFSYGDYLRAGALARFSHIMQAVIDFAEQGGLVWGICNGFQVLCEAGLLPGVLLPNTPKQFVCKNVFIKAETNHSPITQSLPLGKPLQIPIAHADGRYYADGKTLSQLIDNEQILFRYCDAQGQSAPSTNPNGTSDNIAGICNRRRNVFGMMPHPERAAEDELGNADGKLLFESLIKAATPQLA
jgi:phosphoribosylformylglycinamidine synthase I